MSELRKDPVVDCWVIIAAERGRRPSDFPSPQSQRRGSGGASCPFCEGNEAKTPPEIQAIRRPNTAPNSPGWEVRVVPNKFPALGIEGELDRRGLGMFDYMGGVGAHEVIIETPMHDWTIGCGDLQTLEHILSMYQARLTDLYRDSRFRYCVLFRNYGQSAGASLDHPHSQIIAVPIVPARLKDTLLAAKHYYSRKERCIFCDIINQELALGDRVVIDREHFVALAPFASRFPFELAIYPKQHQHDLRFMDEVRRMALAEILHDCVRYISLALGNPAYNYVVKTAPNAVPRPGKPDYWGTLQYDFHWHLEIIPRVTRIAGFEWGTGFYINPVAPEDATKFLHEKMAEDTFGTSKETAG
ncbi:MAG: galactose-1-phosphate uridylyltransferase [Candidatus Zipacnadales bacterium]